MKHFIHCVLMMAVFSCTGHTARQDTVKPVREDIEWLDVWLPHSNDTLLPRVLLIGNSITRSYYKQVETNLKDKAYIGRLATSKSIGDPALIAEITMVLQTSHFDIVHFNNGLHGWGYSEEEYKNSFPGFVDAIRKNAPDARLIWASTTPVFKKGQTGEPDPKTERVVARNHIALEILHTMGIDIRVNDLFSLVRYRNEYYEGGDGTHLVAPGVNALAEQVTEHISEELKKINH